jgi:predicted dehydrogenase
MSATEPIGAVIVGCGVIGINHARAIVGSDALRLVAVVDAIPAAAAGLADVVEKELGAPRPAEFADLSSALAAGGIGLAAVCTPSGTHIALAEEATRAGAHVVIEKPIDVSLPRARQIADLADAVAKDGTVVSVISQHRFDPANAVVAEAAHEGRFGRVTSALASVPWWRTQGYYDSAGWRGTWELDGGGAVMNQGVHTVDLLVWMLGTPTRVSAWTALLAHERVQVEDVAVATLAFESGALAVLHATTAGYPGLGTRIQVHGSSGSAVVDDDRLTYFHSADGVAATGRPDQGDAAPENQAADVVDATGLPGASESFSVGHARQYADIVRAIETGTAPGVTARDAMLSLAAVRSVYLSATLGRPVEFADVLAGRYDDVVVATGPAE